MTILARHALSASLVPLALVFGPPRHTSLDRSAEPLKAEFNADLGKVRLVMYVSPACGECLLGVRQMQQRVLARVPDSGLAVYVVWAPKNGGRERDLSRVTGLVTDTRARQYWDAYGVVATAYDQMLALTGPCAGIFMLYGPQARWDGVEPPRAAYLEDAHAHEFARPLPQFDADRLAERTRVMLAAGGRPAAPAR